MQGKNKRERGEKRCTTNHHGKTQSFNPLTPGTFCQNWFSFYILVLLKLDHGQINFNLVENALVTRQLAVLVTRIALKTFRPRHAQKSKFGRESDLRL